MPIQIEPIVFTEPAAGVIATRPATAPVITPRTVGRPWRTHSMRDHVRPAAAVATGVTTKALAAKPLAPSALPALKPNQPNQSRPAPSTANGRLCGGATLSG